MHRLWGPHNETRPSSRQEQGARVSRTSAPYRLPCKKLASRLLLELESVFSKDPALVSLASAASLPARGGVVTAAPAAGSGVDADVTAALLAMGFTGEEATLALEGHEEAGATSTKAAIQYALKRLGRRA